MNILYSKNNFKITKLLIKKFQKKIKIFIVYQDIITYIFNKFMI